MSGSSSGGKEPAFEKKLLEVTQKRLEKFVSIFPKVLVNDHPETIHDARVWSRRLQQIFRVLFPTPGVGKKRKLIRTLRRVRRALGGCRNLDVMNDLIQEKIESAGNPVVREAWDRVRQHSLEKRATEIVSARKDLSQHDIVAFVNRSQALLRSYEPEERAEEALTQSVDWAFQTWCEALAKAKDHCEPERLHEFRIAGKRLRYRLELCAELGEGSAKVRVKALKALQDQLGDWHDRQLMLQFVAEFISRPAFLAQHPGISRALLLEMEKERRRNDASIDTILKYAHKIQEGWDNSKEAAA